MPYKTHVARLFLLPRSPGCLLTCLLRITQLNSQDPSRTKTVFQLNYCLHALEREPVLPSALYTNSLGLHGSESRPSYHQTQPAPIPPRSRSPTSYHHEDRQLPAQGGITPTSPNQPQQAPSYLTYAKAHWAGTKTKGNSAAHVLWILGTTARSFLPHALCKWGGASRSDLLGPNTSFFFAHGERKQRGWSRETAGGSFLRPG